MHECVIFLHYYKRVSSGIKQISFCHISYLVIRQIQIAPTLYQRPIKTIQQIISLVRKMVSGLRYGINQLYQYCTNGVRLANYCQN